MTRVSIFSSLPSLNTVHEMQWAEAKCVSPDCPADCRIRFKVATCLKTGETKWVSSGQHATVDANHPPRSQTEIPRHRLSREAREHIRENCHLQPFRIHDQVRQLFPDLPLGRRTVKNEVSRVRKELQDLKLDGIAAAIRVMNGSGREDLARSCAVRTTDSLGEDLPYAFGPQVQAGRLVWDNLLIGLTTKRLLRVLTAVASEGGILSLHVDATHGINAAQCRLFVVGISDRAQVLHPLVLFLVKSEDEAAVRDVCMALVMEVQALLGISLMNHVTHLMTDAAGAIWNATSPLFHLANHAMCYFHVVQAGWKRV